MSNSTCFSLTQESWHSPVRPWPGVLQSSMVPSTFGDLLRCFRSLTWLQVKSDWVQSLIQCGYMDRTGAGLPWATRYLGNAVPEEGSSAIEMDPWCHLVTPICHLFFYVLKAAAVHGLGVATGANAHTSVTCRSPQERYHKLWHVFFVIVIIIIVIVVVDVIVIVIDIVVVIVIVIVILLEKI